MGFHICYDSSIDLTDRTPVLDRAMLLHPAPSRDADPDANVDDSKVWECDSCYYVNYNQLTCLGCGKDFVDAENCQARLGLFTANEQSDEECEPESNLATAQKAALAYQHAVEASAAELAEIKRAQAHERHAAQMRALAEEKHLLVQRANEEAEKLREQVLRETSQMEREMLQAEEEAAAQRALMEAKLESEKLLAEAVAASAVLQREARSKMAGVMRQKMMSERPLWHLADTVGRTLRFAE